jgi:AraC-like DNA-binding protein
VVEPLGIVPAGRCGIALLYRERGQRIARHRHAELELNHVTQGRAVYLIGDQRVDLQAHSQLWLFPEQDDVLVEASEDFSMWIVCWAPDYLRTRCTSEDTAVLCRDDPGGVLSRCLRPDRSRRLTGLLEEATAHPSEGGGARDAALGYALHLAWSYFAESRELPEARSLHPAVERAVRLLSGEDGAVPIAAVASRCGISTSRLGELFRDQLGLSPIGLRNRYRIERFLDVFGNGSEHTVTDAALEAGFGSYPQFYRVFKQVMGYGPAEHRRRAARGA